MVDAQALGRSPREVATVTQVVWDLFEDILHPYTRFNAGILAGTYQRVHYRRAICGGIIAAEEPIFLPKANGLMARSTGLLSIARKPPVTHVIGR